MQNITKSRFPGDRVKSERLRIGIKSQGQAAELFGVKRETWSRYETGKIEMGQDVFRRFVSAGADSDFITTGRRSVNKSPANDAITEDEKELIELFRAAPLVLKAAVIGALHSGSSVLPNGHSGHHVLIGDVSVGNVSSGQGGVTIGGVVTSAFREG